MTPDERQQEGGVVLEAHERGVRDVKHRGLDVCLGTGVTVVVSTIVLGEQPDLTDHVASLIHELEGEVGRADPALHDDEQRIRRITRIEQDIVLCEGADLDVLGQPPAISLAQAAEQWVFAEEIANALALAITVRDGNRHGGDSSVEAAAK